MSRYGGADSSFAQPLLWISSVKRSEVDWAAPPRHDVFRKRNGSNDFCHQFSNRINYFLKKIRNRVNNKYKIFINKQASK